ncbi:hypothetical protein STAQ_46930 [Allostella sp. ATCC 35155]|nr:hypothetical protein STAQ_46930 [Stella sp. ATCC 35155]
MRLPLVQRDPATARQVGGDVEARLWAGQVGHGGGGRLAGAGGGLGFGARILPPGVGSDKSGGLCRAPRPITFAP